MIFIFQKMVWSNSSAILLTFNFFLIFQFRWILRWLCIQRSAGSIDWRPTHSISNVCLSFEACARFCCLATTCSTWMGATSWCLWWMLSQAMLLSRIKKLLQAKKLRENPFTETRTNTHHLLSITHLLHEFLSDFL